MAARRFAFALLLFAGLFATGAAQERPAAPPLLKSETTPARNLKVFEALWKRVNESYFDPRFNGADWGKLREVYRPKAQGAQTLEGLERVLEELLGELKTSHLSLRRAVKQGAISSRVGQKFKRGQSALLSTGIGFDKMEDQWVVTTVREASPAAAAGVKIGWLVVRLNGQPVETAEVEPIEGQTLRFGLVDETGTARDLDLPFQWFAEMPDRESRRLDEKLAYLRFGEFEEDVDRWLAGELTQYRDARALILDLRGNTGGWLDQMEKCLALFFPGPVTYGSFIKRNGEESRLSINGAGPQAFAGRLIVLVDAGAASCAEIFAAAIQETGRGRLLGQPTSGQVLPSLQYKLPEGFRLTVPYMDFQTARGRRLEGTGVRPDLATPTRTIADLRRQHDPTLQAAIALFK